MHISVIIPVYNAASFVAQAVQSALAQPEIAEVNIVKEKCLKYMEYDKISYIDFVIK